MDYYGWQALYEEMRRCGHAHQTVDGAAACLTKLTQWYCLHDEPTGSNCEECGGRAAHDHTSGAWWKAQVEDCKGSLADYEDPEWNAMFAKCVTACTNKVAPVHRVIAWSVQQARLAHEGSCPRLRLTGCVSCSAVLFHNGWGRSNAVGARVRGAGRDGDSPGLFKSPLVVN